MLNTVALVMGPQIITVKLSQEVGHMCRPCKEAHVAKMQNKHQNITR